MTADASTSARLRVDFRESERERSEADQGSEVLSHTYRGSSFGHPQGQDGERTRKDQMGEIKACKKKVMSVQ